MSPSIQAILDHFGPPVQATVAPVLRDLVHGADEATTIAHLNYLNTVAGVTVLGWPAANGPSSLGVHYVILFPGTIIGSFVCHIDREADGLWRLQLSP